MARDFARGFYNSAEWRLLRRNVLQRSGYTCALCGGHATEVHHLVELTPANITDRSVALNPRLLQPLCGDCHKRITKIQKGLMPADCDADFYFDADGNMAPRVAQK